MYSWNRSAAKPAGREPENCGSAPLALNPPPGWPYLYGTAGDDKLMGTEGWGATTPMAGRDRTGSGQEPGTTTSTWPTASRTSWTPGDGRARVGGRTGTVPLHR